MELSTEEFKRLVLWKIIKPGEQISFKYNDSLIHTIFLSLDDPYEPEFLTGCESIIGKIRKMYNFHSINKVSIGKIVELNPIHASNNPYS